MADKRRGDKTMNYKKSHMDQKCRPYATKAIENGCNILEVDIQSACGKIVLGHNWRPKLPFLFDCTLENYLKRVPFGVMVQLDIKEICLTDRSRKKFAERIADVINKYKDEITFLISANNGFYRPLTSDYVRDESKLIYWSNWKDGKIIETVDLWK